MTSENLTPLQLIEKGTSEIIEIKKIRAWPNRKQRRFLKKIEKKKVGTAKD